MKKVLKIILICLTLSVTINLKSYSQFTNEYSLSRKITENVSGQTIATIIDTIDVTNTNFFSIDNITVTEVFTNTSTGNFSNPGLFSLCISDTLSTVVRSARTLNNTDNQNAFNFHFSTFNAGISNIEVDKTYTKLPGQYLIIRFQFRPTTALTNTNLTISYTILGTYQ